MAPTLSLLLATTSMALLLFSRAVAHDTLPLGSSLAVEAFQTDVLQSPDGTFSCGFYSIYTDAFTFSIWHSKAADKTVVWSANRGRPVHVKRAAFTLQRDGNMVLVDYDGAVVWQAGGNFTNVQQAQLLDTGNLILKDTDGPGIKRRLTLDPDGNLRLYSLNDLDGSWSVSMAAISQPCNVHGLCGPNGICHYSPKPTCSCAPGYVMSNPGNWTEGCTAIVNITCDHQEPMKFVKLKHTDFWGSDQKHLLPVSFYYCRNICMNDCTCKGFQYQEDTSSCYPKASLFSGRTYPTNDARTIYLKLPDRVNVSNTAFPRSDVFDPAPPHLDCNQMSIPPILEAHNTDVEEPKWLYFYGFIAAFFVVEVSFIAFTWFFVLRREVRPSEVWATEEGYKVMTSHFRRYSYRELVKATMNFKVELGRGSSGVVYKGVLEDERPVALKKLKHISRGKEEFQAELSVIARIYHMNLVRIWGFCSEGSHRLLVCEYVENGSLASILFGDKSIILLDWKQRFNIALGVAKGLAYLHHECLEWVIHCDVKPENILLDQNFEPKITDFGLAKLLNRGGSNQNTSHVRGTTGYIAPEWISGRPITSKVDVYSYGVVLLELLSGSRVSELTVGSDAEVDMVIRKLVTMLADKLEGNDESWIEEFVDCKLGGQFSYVQARTLIKLVVSCLEEDTRKRSTMESVVQTLLSSDEADK
uniref:Receptor-like serine/threonine-protein kinase n=1 Tax=Aegilops tauschii subsp. strangulata TaxID=200361 RepID=A0A453MGQ3_AEGTS